jgi:hypothetical protein
MTRTILLLASLLLTVLALGCSGPFVLLPGGALDGEVAPAPESWAFTDEIDTIQLETNPAEPYSVNIWVVALGDALYVHAGANRATWVEHMEHDPNVRLKAGDAIYELAAARVTGQDEFGRFSDAYEKKYGRRPRNENVGEAYLFRLAAR